MIGLLKRLISWAGTRAAAPTNPFSAKPGIRLNNRELEQRAENFLRAGRIEAASEVFRELQAQQVAQGLVIRVLRDAVMDASRFASGEPYVAVLSHVEVDTGYWNVFDQDKVYVKETYGRNFSKSPLVGNRVTPDQNQFLVSYWPSGIHVDEPCVLIGSDENYSHWLLRSLLKLWLFERQPSLSHHPWLVGEQLNSYQREYLELLGFSEKSLISVPRNTVVSCRRLFVPQQMRGDTHFRIAVEWIQKKLRHFMAEAEQATDRIFVSRHDAAHRFLVNEDELFAALLPYGFQRVVPGKMAVREQIEAFSRARMIVAPHGAALTNIIFCQPGLRLIEITSSNMLHMADFRWIAQVMKHRVMSIVSDDYVMDERRKGEVREVNWDYRVSVPEVVKAVLDQA